MLFNSIEFLAFLPLVFLFYWYILGKNNTLQNIFLLVASYVFYGWWDYRFLGLIVLSTVIDYFVGLSLSKTTVKQHRKLLLIVSICSNLGILMFFKYFNFFVDSFITGLEALNVHVNYFTLKVILPVGISFYTFQTLSYSIDIYREKIEPTRNFINFAAFVSFFPQLVAGPIERAKNLLPQFEVPRNFDPQAATDGMRQILWGLFKKVVIADNLGVYVNYIFENHQSLPGSTLLIGAVFFAFVIYGDFSGYSDIAIGTARLFGFNLMKNFAFPYFSRDIAEFWRRWHISLSSWFKDYLYIPLGGSKGPIAMKLRNTMIIFVVSGFWHGANWTFIVWGFLNAVYFIPLLVLNKNRNHLEIVAKGKILPSINEIFKMGTTFFLTLIAWVFFRAENVKDAFQYLSAMFSKSMFSIPRGMNIQDKSNFFMILAVLVLFVVIEWLQREKEHSLEIQNIKRLVRWPVYVVLSIGIMYLGNWGYNEFIYFQF